MRRKRKILIWSTLRRIISYQILERMYAQNNAHFWEQNPLLLLSFIKKYIEVPCTYQEVSFLYLKDLLSNKISDKNLVGLKHASNFLRSVRSWICKLSPLPSWRFWHIYFFKGLMLFFTSSNEDLSYDT